MQGATELHHYITYAFFPQTDPVFHNTAALDTAVDMLDPEPPLVECLVGPFLLPCQLLAAGFLRRHEDHHLRERERQEAQILQQPTARGQGIRRRVGNGLVMGATAVRVAQEEDRERRIDQENIFHRVVFFLAALTLEFIPITLQMHTGPSES